MNAHAQTDMVNRHTAAAKVSTVANGTACIQEFVLTFIRGKGMLSFLAQVISKGRPHDVVHDVDFPPLP